MKKLSLALSFIMLAVMLCVPGMTQAMAASETITVEAENYDSASWTVATESKGGTGTTILFPWNPSNEITYEVEISKDGYYAISADLYCNIEGMFAMTVKEGDTTLIDAASFNITSAATGSYAQGGTIFYAMDDNNLGTVYLTRGTHLLTFVNASKFFRFDKFSLTETLVSITKEAENYKTASWSPVATESKGGTGTTIRFPWNASNEITYEVVIPKDGYYKISADFYCDAVGTYAMTVKEGEEILIDSANFNITADAGSYIQSQVTFYAMDSNDLGSVVLTRGTHLLTFVNTSKFFRFDKFTIAETTDIKISTEAESYKTASWTVATESKGGAGTTILFPWNASNQVTYEVNIPVDGYYRVRADLYCDQIGRFFMTVKEGDKTLVDGGTVLISTEGPSYVQGGTTFYGAADNTIGYADLRAGTRTLTFVNSSKFFRFDKFILEKAGEYGTGEYVYQAESYISAKQVSGGNETVFTPATHVNDVGGTNVVFPWNPNSYLTYKITVPSDGLYKLNASFYCDAPGSYSMTIAENGVNILTNAPVTIVNTGSSYTASGATFYAASTKELGFVNLLAGEHTITFVNTSKQLPFDYFSIQKVGSYASSGTDIVIEAESRLSDSTGTLTNQSSAMILGKEQHLSYSVAVPVDGTYKLSALAAQGDEAQLPNILGIGVNGVMQMRGIIQDNGSYAEFVENDLGYLSLAKGMYTIKIMTVDYSAGETAASIIDRFTLTRTGDVAPEALSINGTEVVYTGMGQGIDFYDTTPGETATGRVYDLDLRGLEVVGGFEAMELAPTEWIKYNLTAENAGYYALKLTVAGSENVKTIEITDARGTKSYNVKAYGEDVYGKVVLGAVFLEKGTNEIKIKNADSSSDYFDIKTLSLTAPEVKLYTGFVDYDNVITEVCDGKMIAKVQTLGAFSNENANVYFVVYKNNQIYKINYINDTVADGEDVEIFVEGIETNDTDTFTAKVFVWDANMVGNCFTW